MRHEIAQEEEVPAYVIFSDAALRQMEILRPMSDEEFLAVDGVGKAKLEKYGNDFINAIIEFQRNKSVVKREKRKVLMRKLWNYFKLEIRLLKLQENEI